MNNMIASGINAKNASMNTMPMKASIKIPMMKRINPVLPRPLAMSHISFVMVVIHFFMINDDDDTRTGIVFIKNVPENVIFRGTTSIVSLCHTRISFARCLAMKRSSLSRSRQPSFP
jgi:hypothetical protein